MELIYQKPHSLLGIGSTFCAGCLHGVAFKLIAEVLDTLNLRERTVGILPVGCATMAHQYNNYDMIVSSHGRAPAIAAGYKRCMPDRFVFAYQGDGDLASIGLAEAIHTANRGEHITTFFINNGIFGMTGGQMAPTTLVDQKASTCIGGRQVETCGFPLRIAEMIASLETPGYVARFALNTPKNIILAKKGIEKAINIQMSGKGYSFIEFLSNCPTNWGMTPEDSLDWIEERMLPYFPLGEMKDYDTRSG